MDISRGDSVWRQMSREGREGSEGRSECLAVEFFFPTFAAFAGQLLPNGR